MKNFLIITLLVSSLFSTFVAVRNSAPYACADSHIKFVAQVGEVCQVPVDHITKALYQFQAHRWVF